MQNEGTRFNDHKTVKYDDFNICLQCLSSEYINCVNREPDDSEEDKDTLTIFLRSMVTVIISSGKQELK